MKFLYVEGKETISFNLTLVEICIYILYLDPETMAVSGIGLTFRIEAWELTITSNNLSDPQLSRVFGGSYTLLLRLMKCFLP